MPWKLVNERSSAVMCLKVSLAARKGKWLKKKLKKKNAMTSIRPRVCQSFLFHLGAPQLHCPFVSELNAMLRWIILHSPSRQNDPAWLSLPLSVLTTVRLDLKRRRRRGRKPLCTGINTDMHTGNCGLIHTVVEEDLNYSTSSKSHA